MAVRVIGWGPIRFAVLLEGSLSLSFPPCLFFHLGNKKE